MKKFFNWLIDTYLYNYIVRREDYNHIQQERWRAEERERHLIEEQRKLYDQIYARRFKRFEEYGDDAVVTYIQNYNVQLCAHQLSWNVFVPDKQYVTSWNLKEEGVKIQENVVSSLCLAFAEHIRKQLFGSKH